MIARQIELCAEFSPLRWLAATPDEAFAGIRALVSDCVADMKAEGEPLPEPLPDRSYSGRFVARVHLKSTAPWR